MRAYFFGDIHGNLYALEACLKHLTQIRPDACYCLGDIVGWLPFGDRTLARMRDFACPTVAGNHDLMAAGVFTDNPSQLDRQQATAYTAGLLSTIPGALDYLGNLPLLLEGEHFTIVHHSPFLLPSTGKTPTIDSFGYLDEPSLEESLIPWLKYPNRLIISGHDHVPAIYRLPEGIRSPRLRDIQVYQPPPKDLSFTVELDPNSRYWVKVGSIGGPYRDGIPVANSALFDSQAKSLTLFRIPYPRERLKEELESHRFAHNLQTIKKYIRGLSAWS